MTNPKTDSYEHGSFVSTDTYSFIAKPGVNVSVVESIAGHKLEPTWMLKKRLDAFKIFESKPMPAWGGDLSQINFDAYSYYLKPTDKEATTWADVPDDIKNTFDRLKIPQAEREVLSGVKAQFDSEVIDVFIRVIIDHADEVMKEVETTHISLKKADD